MFLSDHFKENTRILHKIKVSVCFVLHCQSVSILSLMNIYPQRNNLTNNHSLLRMDGLRMTDTVTPQLGDLETSEKLIFDLYIDLRRRINSWAAITQQTAQARMGYVGQHLTSVVTGYPGGRSGARGNDLVLPGNKHAEIKTCYRIDQLGKCNACNSPVASIESFCPVCFSRNIRRNDDSKWLIGIRNRNELANILEPESYYLVLFEFIDLQSPDAIRASIWEVNPKHAGFAFCMVDYRLNIQERSRSRAPFNLWPYQLKFCLMRPLLIYQSVISTVDDSINTLVFPGRDQAHPHNLKPLREYSRSQNLTLDKIIRLSELLGVPVNIRSYHTKRSLLDSIQSYITEKHISPTVVADQVATALYFSDIEEHIPDLPKPLKGRIEDLTTAI